MSQSQSQSQDTSVMVLWDGNCGFCRRCVRWVEAQPRGGRYTAVPYQQAPRPPMTDALADACSRAVHVVLPGGEILRGGDAVLWVLADLGWPGARILRLWPFLPVVRVVYGIVARNRLAFSRWFFPCEDGGRIVGRRSEEPCGS